MSVKRQSPTSRAGILSVSIAAVLWGTVGIATQSIYHCSNLTAVTVGFYRLFFALPIVVFLYWRIIGNQPLQVDRRQYGKMVLIGIMLALYQVFYFASIRYVGVAIATLVTLCTAPVLVSLLSTIVLKERLRADSVISLLAAVLGTILLIGLPERGAVQENMILGIVLALGSATGYAIVTLDRTDPCRLQPRLVNSHLLRCRRCFPFSVCCRKCDFSSLFDANVGIDSVCWLAADRSCIHAVFFGDA